MNELWNSLSTRASVMLSAAQHQQLSLYLDLLFAANAMMNLTRITERAAAEVQHVGDSLTLLPFLPPGPHALVDVGSGGGVPGIPLAIARPDADVLLVESTKKKAAFLERAAAELGLANLRVSSERAEDVAHSERRESFDVATVRAVATTDWLVEWCLPLVRVGGRVLAMKGQRAADELPAAARIAKLLGGAAPISHSIELPETEHHVVIEIRKTRKTPLKFPRLASAAKGKPL